MSIFTPPASHSCKFDQPGDVNQGEILEISERMQATKYNSTEPDFWPSGDPIMQVKVTLQTDLRDPEDPKDDGKRGLFVVESSRQGGLLWAIREAIKTTDADDLRPGGYLQVAFTGYDPESKNPANPRKLYQARYRPPATGGGLFRGGQQPLTTIENQMSQPDTNYAQHARQFHDQQQNATPAQQLSAPASGGPFDQNPADMAHGQWPPQGGGQQPPAPAHQAPTAPPPAPQSGGVDPQTATNIKALIGMGADTPTIVNSIANPQVTTQVVDSLRAA